MTNRRGIRPPAGHSLAPSSLSQTGPEPGGFRGVIRWGEGCSPSFLGVREGGLEINPGRGGDRAGRRLKSKKVSLDHSGGELAPGSGASLEVRALRPRPGREAGGCCVQRIPGGMAARETLIRSFYT